LADTVVVDSRTVDTFFLHYRYRSIKANHRRSRRRRRRRSQHPTHGQH